MSVPKLLIFSLVLTITNQLPLGIKNDELPKIVSELNKNVTNSGKSENVTVSVKASDRTLARNTIRPGMIINSYAVNLEPDEARGTFRGELAMVVTLTAATREDDIVLHTIELHVTSVEFAIGGGTTLTPADYDVDDGILTIATGQAATTYRFVIKYEGNLNQAIGLFSGSDVNGNSYLAMNLHPTNARRVFPCVDELTEATTLTLSINGVNYNNMISNSILEENSQSQFRPLQGPSHLWGLMAHSFTNINNPVSNRVSLHARPGVSGQDSPASLAINSYMAWLEAWTNKDYSGIIVNQEEWMHVIAVPDVSIDWYSLSIVGVWEPYILMPTTHAVMQRKISLIKIAEAMSRKWFGYVIYPENWIHNWFITGLGTYAAYEAVSNFETNTNQEDDTLLDVETMFVTDIIQESLLYDSYSSALILQPDTLIYDEDEIRDTISGLVKYKAPAIMSLLRLVLGDANRDFIRTAARGLFVTSSLQTVNTLSFVDAINSEWSSLPAADRLIDDVEEFLEPYITRRGYPVVRVNIRQGGVTLTQQHYGFATPVPTQTFEIPITFTRSAERNFDNIYPFMVLDVGSFSHDIDIEDEDAWVIYNIRGRGYYRVNYDNELMERLTEALDDPDRREEIHPLNRATLVDDSLNLARGGLLSYELAFELVLTMVHETEYAPWKAFVRSMDFLRKRLVALVDDDEDLDPDIYLRMVRRTIGAVERELGFEPSTQLNEPPMTSLTRGIVMDHACRAGYAPCIAAAIDWFFDPSSDEPTVNPNIPHDIRPAVFCTMVREGGADAIAALNNRLEIEPVMYERVVILESLACSQDADYINSLLAQTIAANSPYSPEERIKIFKAVAGASHNNANLALQFIGRNTNAVRTRYGGEAKLEEVIFALAENMVDGDLADNFDRWVISSLNNLDDSNDIAIRANEMVIQNLAWNSRYLDEVYEWIDENDATTAALSMFLICLTFALTLFNH